MKPEVPQAVAFFILYLPDMPIYWYLEKQRGKAKITISKT